MSTIKILTGNYAVAWGVKLSRVKVIAAYPITPQTTIVEKIAEFVENGEMDAKYLMVESEHSAMAATIGASATGVRAFTATSSQGLLYMHEMVWWASAARLPIVMAVVMRALAPPWSIWNEHTDLMDQRDTGWLITLAENNQEVLDSIIMSYRISEHEDVLLPSIVGLDAFILSHTLEPVEIPGQDLIDEFLPPRPPKPFTLNPENPITHGGIVTPEYYMEFRYLIEKGMENARRVIVEVAKEYKNITGRWHGDLVDEYKCSDAKILIIVAGATAGTCKEAVDVLREKGFNVGVLRLRYIRPFPSSIVRERVSSVKSVVIIDRSYSFGGGGIIGADVASSIYGSNGGPLIHDLSLIHI